MTERLCEVQLRFPVRTYDIDYAGIVSNIVYIRWLEDLRLAMLDAHYPLKLFHDAGLTPVLLETKIRYRSAVRLFEEAVGRMWVTDVGRVRWSLAAEITVGATLAASAEQECAVISLGSGRPRPLPADLLRAFDA
jgi:acyl-CoA thioester hydrolase